MLSITILFIAHGCTLTHYTLTPTQSTSTQLDEELERTLPNESTPLMSAVLLCKQDGIEDPTITEIVRILLEANAYVTFAAHPPNLSGSAVLVWI